MKKNRIFRDPNIWIGLSLAAIVVPALIYGLVQYFRCKPENKGFMPCPTVNGKSLVPRFAPNGPLWTVIGDKSIDKVALDYAVNAWNARVGYDVFSSRIDQEWFSDPDYVLSNEYKFGTVSITLATEPTNDDDAGVTHHNFDKKSCEVYWIEITVNPIYTLSEGSYKAAIMHELGHALLLDHDGSHPTSIMSDKLNTSGVILNSDAGIVRKLLLEMKQKGERDE